MTISTDRYRSDLIALVDRFKDASGMADSTISRSVFITDGEFVTKLRAGANFTVEKGKRLEAWLREQLGEIADESSAASVG